MNNKNLRKAFYEAAEKELEHLPKEEDIFRNYSDDFEAKMKKLLNEEKQKEMTVMNKKHFSFKKTAIVVAAIILCFAITASAGQLIQMKKGSELIPMLQEAVSNATVGVGVEEFDEAIAKSDDPWAIESGGKLLLDYTESMDYNISVEDKGYLFTLKSVTKALKKQNQVVSGNILDGTAVFECQVDDAYYALVEVSRADGKKLDPESDKAWVEWNFMIEGFEPWSTNMCLRGFNGSKSYEDDYKVYFAIDITNMMCFADRDFALVALEHGYGYTIDQETVYADKEGEMILKNDDFIGALLRFKVDDKYADEKAAEEFVVENAINNPIWFKGYTKD